MGWIEPKHAKLPLTRQCELTGVPRATVYRRMDAGVRAVCETADDLKLWTLNLEKYTKRPFYGSRRIVVFLRAAGQKVNRKRVQRLIRSMGLAADSLARAPDPLYSL